MQRRTFNAALEATMRVACCTALLGTVACKPKTASVSSPGEAIQQSEEKPGADTDVEAPGTERPIPEPVSEFPDGFDECKEDLEAFFVDVAPGEPSEKTKACCDSYISHNAESETMSGTFRYECCALSNWVGGSLFCTPWGPPTPPRMPGSIA
jgi:hypothetical protein